MVSKADVKTTNKKVVGPTYVNPQKVSYLLCFKYKDELHDKGLIYYEVIPFVSNNQNTIVKDLRTNKNYATSTKTNVPKWQQYEELLTAYGIDTTTPPTYCGVVDFVTLLNVAHYGGTSSKIYFNDEVFKSEKLDQELVVALCDDMADNEKTKAFSKDKAREL